MVKEKSWKYKAGGKAQGLIPSLFLLALFGGAAAYLCQAGNGAFLFCAALAVITAVLAAACLYRAGFVKVLIGEDGFYHQTKPGNGRYIAYGEAEEAWAAAGKSTNGMQQYACTVRLSDGRTIRFSFTPSEGEGVAYLLARVKEARAKAASGERDGAREYVIDGKAYGKTRIAAACVLLVLFLIMAASAAVYALPPGGFGAAAFFMGSGLLLVLGVLAVTIVRWACFRVRIGKDGFFLRQGLFCERYYAYGEVESCRTQEKVYRHRRPHGAGSKLYYTYFIFTTRDGKTRRFLYEQAECRHEIAVLKKRIGQAGGE